MPATDPLEHLRDAADRLGPDPDAQARMLARMTAELEAGEAAAAPAAIDPARRTPRRRRAPRIAFGAVVAGAAAVALVVALAPDGSPSRPSPIDVPASAAAQTLRAAGDAAGTGAADWTPLGPDEYFHLYSTSFVPDIPRGPGDPPAPDGPSSVFLGGAQASESWFGSDGSGQVVSISGTNGDPARPPSLYRDPATGEVAGVGTSSAPPEVSVEQALRQPDTTNVMAWPRDGRTPYQHGWARTRTGFLQLGDTEMTLETTGAEQSPEATLRMFWGTTAAAIDAANADPDPDRAAQGLIDQVIGDPGRPRGVGVGSTNGIEPSVSVPGEQLDREAGIQLAVQLLGATPLSPDVRRALYRWLARQPGASIRDDARDEIGRPGVEITFEHVDDHRIPDHTVTAREVLAPWVDRRGQLGAAGRQLGEIDQDRVYRVTGNRDVRRWRVSFVVEPASGELLQQYTYERQVREGDAPYFVTLREGPRILVGNPGGGSGAGGAQLYLARDRTDRIAPTAAVCVAHPEVCR